MQAGLLAGAFSCQAPSCCYSAAVYWFQLVQAPAALSCSDSQLLAFSLPLSLPFHALAPFLLCCRLSQELELKQHSLKLLEERMAGSEAAQLAEAVAATQQELEEATAAVAAAQEKKKEMVAAAKVGTGSSRGAASCCVG